MNTPRDDNDTFLRRLWTGKLFPWWPLALLSFSLFTQTFFFSPKFPNILQIWTATLLGLLAWFFWMLQRTTERTRRLLLQKDPERLARTIRAKNFPYAEIFTAHAKAGIYTIYGRFDVARDYLRSTADFVGPALIHGDALYVHALLCFLDTRDFAAGLHYAHLAREAAQVSRVFPGLNTFRTNCEILIETGQALTGTPDLAAIEKLMALRRSLIFGQQLVATWCLAVVYHRLGDHTNEQLTLERCRTLAPYCFPLHTVPS